MVSVRPVLPRVIASASSMLRRMASLKRLRSPMTRRRILFWCIFTTRFCSAIKNRFIKNDTSSSGRRQFSVEKANTVKKRTPARSHTRHMFSKTSSPFLCPITRGMKRFFAQRPLPSIITATWCGTVWCSGMVCVLLGGVMWIPSCSDMGRSVDYNGSEVNALYGCFSCAGCFFLPPQA